MSSKTGQLHGLRALNEISSRGFATRAVHGDVVEEPDHAPALHVATNFSLRSERNDYIYSRSDCPTRARVEQALEQLEGGKTLLFSSGMAAITSVMTALKPTCVLLVNVGYTGTLSYFRESATCMAADLETLAAHPGKSKVIFCEAIQNPTTSLSDLSFLTAAAKHMGAVLVCDATFATPVLCRPLSLGANFKQHARFIGGHSDVLAGSVSCDVPLYLKLRHLRTHLGCVPGNLECFLLLRSLKTLVLRVVQQARNARAVCDALARHPNVESVLNGAVTEPKTWAQLLASGGMSCSPKELAAPCFSIVVREGVAKTFLDRLMLFEPATSLGGVSSSVDWRHRWDSSANERLFRLSVGVEDANDLIEDLNQALH